MARGYSRDLRERLLQAHASGLPMSEVASLTGVSRRTLHRWKAILAAGGTLDPRRSPGSPRKISPADEAALRKQVTAMPDATLAEHCATWAAAGHPPVSTATMSRQLSRQGLPLKKRR